MPGGQPIHVDQQRLAPLEEHVARVEVAVEQRVGLGQRVQKRHAPLRQGPVLPADAAFDVVADALHGAVEAVLGRDLRRVDRVGQLRHQLRVGSQLAGVPGDAGGERVGVHQLVHGPVLVPLVARRLDGYDAEGNGGGDAQYEGLAGHGDFLLHVAVGVVLVVDLDDQLVVIAVHVALGPAPDALAALHGHLAILPIARLVGIKRAGPDEVDVLDELLERAGLVQRQLQLLRDGLVVPVVHLGVALMEVLPGLFAVLGIIARQRADVGQLVRQPQHPHALIVGIFQYLQRFLLAALPALAAALARVLVFRFGGHQEGHALAESLLDLPKRAVGVLHDVVQNARGDDVLVVRHRGQNLRHLQRVQYIGNAAHLAHLALVHHGGVDDGFFDLVHHGAVSCLWLLNNGCISLPS